jgi:Notch-like protein
LTCEAELDECSAFGKCDPTGTEACLDLDNEFKCTCRNGFIGEFCQTNVDDCASNPCMNGGRCNDEIGGFVCDCLKGNYLFFWFTIPEIFKQKSLLFEMKC